MAELSRNKVRWASYRYRDSFKQWKVPEADESWLIDVCLQPDDALPRLLYADWLDDGGRPVAANFWREISKAPLRVPLRWTVPTTSTSLMHWHAAAGGPMPMPMQDAWRQRQPGGRCAWLNYAAAVTWQVCRFDFSRLTQPVPGRKLGKTIGDAASHAVVGPHVVRELGAGYDLDSTLAAGADELLGTGDYDAAVRLGHAGYGDDCDAIPDVVVYRGQPSRDFYAWRRLSLPAHGIVQAVEYPTTLDAFMDLAVAYSEADFGDSDDDGPDFEDAYLRDDANDEAELDDPDDVPELPPLDWSTTNEGH